MGFKEYLKEYSNKEKTIKTIFDAQFIAVYISSISLIITFKILYKKQYIQDVELTIMSLACFIIFASITFVVFFLLSIKNYSNEKQKKIYNCLFTLFVSIFFVVFFSCSERLIQQEKLTTYNENFEEYKKEDSFRVFHFKDENLALYKNLLFFEDSKKILLAYSYRFATSLEGFVEENNLYVYPIELKYENVDYFKFVFDKDNVYAINNDKIFEVNNIEPFQYYGMGLRNKYLLISSNNDNSFSSSYRLIDLSSNTNVYENILIEDINLSEYYAIGSIDGKEFKIFENEYGIYVDYNNETICLDNSQYINIPEYTGENRDTMRQLFNEIMVNIESDGIKPNIQTYPNTWYRDAAMSAMIIAETGNISQIEPWIENLSEMYDKQNSGVEEIDNLGQVLYLCSLVDNPNQKLINDIIEEAKKYKTEENYIVGLTDYSEHPIYQTVWLKFGLESLGYDSSEYSIPYHLNDDYAALCWFYEDLDKSLITDNKYPSNYYCFPYLKYAKDNFFERKSEFKKQNKGYYSYEYTASNADYKNGENIYMKEITCSYPHSWAAAEMYQYLANR